MWRFQHILGREPSDEKAIGHFVDTERDFGSLVTTLVASHEFQQLHINARLRGVDREGFVYDDQIPTQERAMRIPRRLDPYAAAEFRKICVGNDGDGGYVTLDDSPASRRRILLASTTT